MTDQVEYIELKLIAERLRQLRKSHGHSNYESIAYELNMSRSAYWRLESGKNFELKTLIKICRLLGVTLSEFFDGINFPKPVKKVKKSRV
jgi:transcriptional regulator with XRE-family HTH domain